MDKKSIINEKKDQQPLTKPDPETLKTTDPQEHMEGPISSIVQGVKEKAEEEDGKKPVTPKGDAA